MKKRGLRVEKDYLGAKKIPSGAYYGVQTQRALENFPVSGLRMQKSLIYALAMVKEAAAHANVALGRLDKKKGQAVMRACRDIYKGMLDDQFPVDVFQAGAGTSEHMNVNEVIANRALQMIGKKKGSYDIIHPNDHVNLGQSTNDVFHSAIHLAAYLEIKSELLPALRLLERALWKKAKRWRTMIKSGRTHLRDAVPMTLGQEFGAYATNIRKHCEHIELCSRELLEINLGGTAIGTSVNAPHSFQQRMVRALQKITKTPFRQASDLIEATQGLRAIAVESGALKVLAEDLIKMANDVRLLSSGPATGLNELELPAVQPGSSIMPGKVNPVMAEMLDMAGYQVMGNDATIGLCSQAGQLELNVMTPLVAYTLLQSIEILSHSVVLFTRKCVMGIKAHPQKMKEFLERNPIIVTALTPYLGYDAAADIAKEAYRRDMSIRDLVLKKGLMDAATLDKALRFGRMTPTH